MHHADCIRALRFGRISQYRRFHRGIGDSSNSIMERYNGSEERKKGREEGRTQGCKEGRTQGRKEGRKEVGEKASLAVGQ
jgi:hypothetical protein